MKKNKSTFFSVINCSLLIAGTCIGGGMLALPLAVGSFGFLPSVAIMFLCCIFMMITALLYMEATLWMGAGAHMSTLSNVLLNRTWRIICFLTYLFICYASIVAYISAAGSEIICMLKSYNGYLASENEGIYIFSAIFGCVLMLGHKFLGRVNTLLFAGMVGAYFLLIYSGMETIRFDEVSRKNWSFSLFFASPIMLAAFSFPGIVPSITQQLEKNSKNIITSIVAGTVITFLFYAVWLFLIFGAVSYEGEFGLKHAYIQDIPATQCLYYIANSPLISISAQYFALFALITSFLGISLSLFDFFCDTFSIRDKDINKNFLLTFIIIVPSIFIAIKFNRVFLSALEISGGIGDALLSGMIPVLMVWNGRYFHNYRGDYKVFGGKVLLIFVFIFSLAVFFGNILMISGIQAL